MLSGGRSSSGAETKWRRNVEGTIVTDGASAKVTGERRGGTKSEHSEREGV